MDRVDRLQSLLSSPSTRYFLALGETSGFLIGIASSGILAIADDVVFVCNLASRSYPRFTGRSATRYGGDVPGRSFCGAWTSRVLAAVGAVSVSASPGPERSLSRPLATNDHCPHGRCSIALPPHPGLLRRVYDRNTGGLIRNCRGVRRFALSDCLECFRLFLRRGNVSKPSPPHIVYYH